MTSINKWCQDVYEYAVNAGWWDDPEHRSIGDLIALMHSELSEALEEHRNGYAPNHTYYQRLDGSRTPYPRDPASGILHKPEGIPSELADVVIRIFDFCGRFNIDLEKAVQEKHAYNLTRGYRHGGKAL